MSETAATQSGELIVECEELEDPSLPVRQGDVLEWLNGQDDLWRRYAIVVTADCDLAHQKHAGLLACVPVLAHEDYLALFPLPARLARAKAKLLERAFALIRGYQQENRPDFPLALSDDAVVAWIEAAAVEEILSELRVTDEKGAKELTDVLGAIQGCSRASAAGGVDPQLDALTVAWLVTQGKSTFEDRRPVLARELLDQLGRLPGDAVFLHALSQQHQVGYVAYLRSIVNVQEATVARRVRDLRDATMTVKRIARLRSPYVFHLSQALGHVFSAIGLPSQYEASRDAFIARRVTDYGGAS
jgi:hypothetical protein